MNLPMPVTTILDRLYDQMSDCLDDESATRLVGFQADEATQTRIDDLARRCDEGRLTPAERAEYESYVRFGNHVAILQAKARLRLRSPGLAR